jgi:hypothetical protein
VREYLALVAEQTGAKIFFVDEAHFRADGDLRGLRICKGTPALVDSTSPRWGEKASYYSAVQGAVRLVPEDLHRLPLDDA